MSTMQRSIQVESAIFKATLCTHSVMVGVAWVTPFVWTTVQLPQVKAVMTYEEHNSYQEFDSSPSAKVSSSSLSFDGSEVENLSI